MGYSETNFRDALEELLASDEQDLLDGFVPSLLDEHAECKVESVRTFEEAMVLTYDEEGLVCTLRNGDVFYLTIQKR